MTRKILGISVGVIALVLTGCGANDAAETARSYADHARSVIDSMQGDRESKEEPSSRYILTERNQSEEDTTERNADHAASLPYIERIKEGWSRIGDQGTEALCESYEQIDALFGEAEGEEIRERAAEYCGEDE